MYKSFRDQYKECVRNGVAVRGEDNCMHCEKYNCVCKSSVCKGERIYHPFVMN